jgi:N,N'-diacetyllegionaminate synthase
MFNKKIKIKNFIVGENHPVFTIAEAGISHFGSMEKAYKLIDLAIEAKADSVKFQIFDIEQMYTKSSKEWIDRLGPRQISYKNFIMLKKYCDEKGIIFFATAHDDKSLNFLIDLDVELFKIGSGEIKNWPYIEKVAQQNKPVILSVGMYKIEDIEEVVNIFKKFKNKNLIILHCVTDYPADPNDIALCNIQMLSQKFNLVTGYSDHTIGYHIPLASVAMGAKVVEKHITLDYNIPNAQDWKVSCGPNNLSNFISELRDVEKAMKIRLNGPTDNEKKNSQWASKSLVLKKSSKKGTLINSYNLIAKRPGGGIPPSDINEVIGKKLKKDLESDQFLTWDIIE